MRATSLGRAEPRRETDQRQQDGGADRGAGEALVVEPKQGRLLRGHEQGRERGRQNQHGREPAHQRDRPRALKAPPRDARDRASARRSPSPAMTATRSASLIAVQAAISATVRPQPTQSAECGSMTQTLTQGVDISGADMSLT